MTKITFFSQDGVFYGFREEGHTGFDESGSDILCAAISSLTMYIVNAVESVFEGEIKYSINEDDTVIEVLSPSALEEFESDEKKRYAVSGIFMSYYMQLKDMVDDYGDYLSIDVEEKDFV